MEKIKPGSKQHSIRHSMAVTFMITICVIGLLSGATIFRANRAQQEILRNRYLTIRSPEYHRDERRGEYVLYADENELERHELNPAQNLAYYGCWFAMVCLPAFYIAAGIGTAAAVYYRRKLRTPILQLQAGIERIQENDLDFQMDYDSDDELGKLCGSMEKMRRELRRNHRQLWEALEQRKLLNASVAHDLRTPITVLRGYLDYLEKNIPLDQITEEMLLETITSMQGAVLRLERYTDCIRRAEKTDSMEIRREEQDTACLVKEMESNLRQMGMKTELGADGLCFQADIASPSIRIDKSVFFRIFENLLQNALRYRKEKIAVELRQKDNLLLLSVKDDGCGFSEEALKKAAEISAGYPVMVLSGAEGGSSRDESTDRDERHSRENGIHSKENEIHTKENEIHSKENEIHSKENEIHTKENEIHSKENEIHSKENGIHSKRDEIHFGIGLGTCRMLCRKHGGYLKIENGGEGAFSGACVTAAVDMICIPNFR